MILRFHLKSKKSFQKRQAGWKRRWFMEITACGDSAKELCTILFPMLRSNELLLKFSLTKVRYYSFWWCQRNTYKICTVHYDVIFVMCLNKKLNNKKYNLQLDDLFINFNVIVVLVLLNFTWHFNNVLWDFYFYVII